jgi:metallo-beta-lactamase family protein
LRVLQEEERIPPIPVYVDSPLAIRATRIFCRHPEALDLEPVLDPPGDDCALLCHHLHLASAVKDSMAINKLHGPLIILSASGMCEAGRVLHHLKLKLPDSRNTVLFVGYQAEGTRGRRLMEGEKEIKIHGALVPVRARIDSIEAFSAHADYEEIFRWLKNFRRPPKMTFLVHGEPSQMEGLAAKISERLGWPVQMPRYLEKVDLEAFLPPLNGGGSAHAGLRAVEG